MKRVYLGNKELTTIATRDSGGGGGDDTQKWVDYFNYTLTEFTIPDGVTSIGEYKFRGCKSLKTITLPDTIRVISYYAFANCASLTSITIPDSVTDIQNNAFNGCKSLTDITISNSIESIDRSAFQGCSSLKTMTVKSAIPPRLYDNAIPTTIETIYVPAGSVESYKSTDGWRAFADKIQAIPIPAMKVTYVDNSEKTFYNSIHIDQNIDSNIANAKNVEIYDGVTTIADGTFYGCKNLTDITVNSTTPPALGNKAIPYEILTIYVPASTLDAYKSANNWSSYADKIYPIGATIPAMKVTYTDNSEKTFINLKRIYQYTDSNKSNAKKVEIYSGVTSIGFDAFENCSSLTGITIPDSVTSIEQTAFYNCSSLTSITLPNTITNISFYMLAGCTSLTSITIPANVTDIDQSAFQDCSKLESVTIPANVTDIDRSAFQGCSKLESVTIQNSTSKIAYEYYAFYGIASTAKLYVPSNLLADYQSDSSWTGAFGGGIFAIQ